MDTGAAGSDSWAGLVRQLAALDFFAHDEPGLADEIAASIGWARNLHDFCSWLTEHRAMRARSIDGEDLAEGGVGAFLGNLSPFLAAFGLTPAFGQELDPNEIHYVVTVDGRPFRIYTRADAEELGTWPTAALNTMTIVETLLREAGFPDRIYTPRDRFVGEGSMMVILTPPMVTAFADTAAAIGAEGLMALDELRTMLD